MPEPAGPTASFDWWFRNRSTGAVTVAQAPNPPLIVWLVATGAGLVFRPEGNVKTALQVVGSAALAIWAVDEIVRGVNPFRRVLGATVLTFQVVALVA